jgi:hypothetical protein
VNGHGNENKGKETTSTYQGVLIFFECTLKSLHKALETKMFKTYCHLNFSKTLKNVIPH